MRRRPTRSSTSSSAITVPTSDTKLFINIGNSLCLVGEKITANNSKSRVRDSKKQHRIEIEEEEEDFDGIDNNRTTEKKKAGGGVELKTCTPLCEDVISRQVRKIRETVQVRDFERLLISVTGATGRHDEERRRRRDVGRLGDVYHDFFGAYYDVLREVVDKRKKKMASVT